MRVGPSLHGRYADGGLTAFAIQVAASLVAAALVKVGEWGVAKVKAYIDETATARVEEAFQLAAIDAGLKQQQEEEQAAQQVKTEPLEEEEEEEETEPTEVPPTQGGEQEPDDVTGRDLLRTLVEFYEKTRLDAFWKAVLSGRVPPDKTDQRDEFFYWLERSGLGDAAARERLRAGMPTPEEDETGYALLYWLWMQSGQGNVRESKWHEYLLRKGAPIDPKPERGRAGRVGSADREWNALDRRLRLRFWA